ncbi:phosphoribosylglycinamide formyltransferase [Phreatobacter sp.]|uniref:phosphoribosylglycinamide formyltransferase n=1 Tax=Phreatobacter sp. TaxID=1966341 RepID=UPI0035233604
MAALVAAAKAEDYPAEIALVLSNVPEAGGLAIAAAEGIATATVDHRAYRRDREAFERAMQDVLAAHRIDIVCLAGFLRILTPSFVGQWEGRMINIHPSLLPAYKGLDTHARALADGAGKHGATVHFVTPGMDEGEIILQEAVPVLPGDTPETLGARVLAVEHEIYPQALRMIATEYTLL